MNSWSFTGNKDETDQWNGGCNKKGSLDWLKKVRKICIKSEK